MSTISFSGLSSGLDTSSMVEQLVAVERAPATAATTKKSSIDTQKSIVNSLSAGLSTLATAVRALDLDSEIKPRTATSSDSRVSVAASSGATPGVHDVRVKSLATSQVTQSRAFASTAAGVLGTGSVDITVGGVTKSVSWTASDSLDAVAAKFNNANAGVTASVVQVKTGEYRLVVTAKDSGTDKAPTFVDNGSGLDLSDGANIKRPAANAEVNVDGIDITRSSNSITDAIPGMTLTLNSVHADGEASGKATVTLDTTALTAKVQKVIDAFNGVNASLHNQLDYTGTKKGDNTLFGDSMLRGLQASLATVKTSAYGENTTLSAIGISIDKGGNLTLDSAKLVDAVTKDPDAVSKIFITNGFAAAVTGVTDRYTSADGMFAAKTQALTDRQKVLQSTIDRINARADSLQDRLEKQFSALEQALSNMKAQSARLSSMLG
jgi:flagellar hook-associated protein 2